MYTFIKTYLIIAVPRRIELVDLFSSKSIFRYAYFYKYYIYIYGGGKIIYLYRALCIHCILLYCSGLCA